MKKLVTVISPVCNEEVAVPLFYERLAKAIRPLEDRFDFEILFSDNRSTDRTQERVLEIRARDPRVQLLEMSRNFGYQQSMTAALRQASGDAICFIDVDCEDPPEMIPVFVEHWEQGFDIVYGERDRRAEPWVITAFRKVFYRVNRLIADSDIILDMAEFCLISSDVRDAVSTGLSTYPFIRAEIAHFGFRRKAIRFDRQPRVAGQSHYNLYTMTRFAVAGILSSTTVPLRIALYLLVPLFAINGFGLWAEISGAWPWGFELLVTSDLLYLCVGLAILALYTARNYRNVINRPVSVVDWQRSALNVPRELSPNNLPHMGPRRPGGDTR